MDVRVFLEEHPFFKKHLLSFGIGCIGLLLIVYGLIGYIGQSVSTPQKDPVEFQSTTSTTSSTSQKENKASIMVDVSGAVLHPGVYKLDIDSRTADALKAAGGMSSEANTDFIAQHINQAAKLVDGAKLYIPKVGEGQVAGTSDSAVSSSNGLININAASEKDLDSLPGVGTVTAGKIINGRPYSAPEDLTTKKIVSKKVFDQIRDKITLY